MTLVNLQQGMILSTNAQKTNSKKMYERAGEGSLFPLNTVKTNEAAQLFLQEVNGRETSPYNLFNDETGMLCLDAETWNDAYMDQQISRTLDGGTSPLYLDYSEENYGKVYKYDSNGDRDFETRILFNNDDKSAKNKYGISIFDEGNSNIKYFRHDYHHQINPDNDYSTVRFEYDDMSVYEEMGAYQIDKVGLNATSLFGNENYNSIFLRGSDGYCKNAYSLRYDEAGNLANMKEVEIDKNYN